MFASILSTFTTARISPSSWDPNSSLPSGSTSIVETFRAPCSPSSTVQLIGDRGAWTHGTVCFLVAKGVRDASLASPQPSSSAVGPAAAAGASSVNPAEGGAAPPPPYEAIAGATHLNAEDVKLRSSQQLDTDGGYLEVRVEARWNDEALWDEAKVDLVQTPARGIDLVIQTPDMSPSRLGSQLSFHITFNFPESLARLAKLATRGSQWRTLGELSLSSLPIGEVDIKTANALIEFKRLKGGKVVLETANKSIKGEYDAHSFEAKSNNGALECEVTATAEANGKTSNASITGTWVASPLSLKTSNNKISGTFTSLALSSPLRLESVNGGLSGAWTGLGGIHATTGNASIDASYKVGKRLELKSSNGSVRGRVTVLGEEVWTEPLERVMGGEGGSAGGKGKLEVDVRTANAKIALEFVKPRATVQVLAVAKTSNAPVEITWGAAYSGSVNAHTSNAEAAIVVPYAHKLVYSHEAKGKKEAIVTPGEGEGDVKGGGGGERAQSSLEVGSSNASVKVLVTG